MTETISDCNKKVRINALVGLIAGALFMYTFILLNQK